MEAWCSGRERRLFVGSDRPAALLLVLQAVEGGVEAVAGQELVVAAGFGQAAVVEDQDAVGVADGRQAVGDDDGSAALHEFFDGRLDELLGFGVDAAGGLVEDEDAGVVGDDAAEGQQLALAGGEVGAGFFEFGLVGLGELFDEWCGLDGFGGPADFVVGDVGAEADVLFDAAGEHEHVLLDRLDGAAQVFEGDAADVGAVDGDAAGLDVPHAGQEVGNGGFAGAGVADDGHGFARLDGEGEVLQDRLVLDVGEVNILELDAPFHRGWQTAGAFVGDAVFGVDEVEDALAPGHGRLHDGELFGEVHDRLVELLHQVYIGDHDAEADGGFDDHLSAEVQHHPDGDAGKEVDHGAEDGEDHHFGQVGLQQLLVLVDELAAGAFFTAEDLHYFHAADVLGQKGVDPADPHPHAAVGVAGPAAEVEGHQQDRR